MEAGGIAGNVRSNFFSTTVGIMVSSEHPRAGHS